MHEVTNDGTDRSQLSHVANETKAALGVEKLDAIADRGYFNSEEISRLLKNSPFPSFEGWFIAEMEADFAVDRAVVVAFGPSVCGDAIHFVAAFPGELGGVGIEGAIEGARAHPNLNSPSPLALN